ncbi:MAG: MATE family efflux transporter [Chloroflexota bacterium]
MDDELELVEEQPNTAAAAATAPAVALDLGHIRQRILTLSLPSLAELLLATLFGMVDMMMVGGIGPAAIAAIGLTNQPMFLGLAIFMALNVGTTALVARSIGAKNVGDACEATRQTMAITLVLGTLVSAAGVIFAEPIIRAMGAEPDALYWGVPYLRIVAGGLIFQTISMSLSAVLRGAGDTKTPMVYNIIANFVNIIGNALLINGWLGAPRLLVAGAAWATSFSRFVGAVLMIRVVYSGKFIINLRHLERFRLRWDLVTRIVKVGTPAAIEQFLMRFGMIMFTRVVSSLGTVVFAAHQVAINIVGLSFTPGQAFGMAATTLVGQSLGAKNPDLAEKSGYETRRIGAYVACAMALVFFFGGRYIARLYTSDPQVTADTALALKIIAIVQPLQSTQFILAGGLRGAGDTFWPLVSTMAGVVVIRVVLAMLFVNVLHLGLMGAWMAMACDQFVRSLVITLRYRSGKWKHIKV